MGSDVVSVQTLEYMTLTTTSTILVNPWYSTALNYNYQVPLFPATDGWQFAANGLTGQNITVFCPDLSQTILFENAPQTQGASFSGFETLFYQASGSATYEPADLNDETFNLTSTFFAPMFATPGLFWNVPAIDFMQYPLDASTGQPFTSSAEIGNSFLIIDANTGVTLQFQQSYQFNYELNFDELIAFDVTTPPGPNHSLGATTITAAAIPEVLILKTMQMSDATTSQLFGYVGSIKTTEWVLFSLFMVLGLGCLGASFVLFRKFKAAQTSA